MSHEDLTAGGEGPRSHSYYYLFLNPENKLNSLCETVTGKYHQNMDQKKSPEKNTPNPEILVFISSRESVCAECHENLGEKAWITLNRQKGALCLACADLDHLVFLPSGDATLTRRTKKHSILSAVVLKWSRSRKRYERQGLLVEEQALEKAEEDCLADQEIRERRREREADRREESDQLFLDKFAKRVRELYVGCPKGREKEIAAHACRKYSHRVGRSASAKRLDEEAVTLAVVAHIRHRETEYDELIARGYERIEARSMVRKNVGINLKKWKLPK
jgi:hypothetical protein